MAKHGRGIMRNREVACRDGFIPSLCKGGAVQGHSSGIVEGSGNLNACRTPVQEHILLNAAETVTLLYRGRDAAAGGAREA